MNFTASVLHFNKKKILDNSGSPIFSIDYVNEKYPLIFLPPRVKYNAIVVRKKAKAPILNKITDLNKLKALGFCLISVPLNAEQIWYPKQKTMCKLCRIGTLEEKSFTKLKMFPAGKDGNHHVIYDEANLIIKLVGLKASRIGESEWIQL